jgi:hypothetical protein
MFPRRVSILVKTCSKKNFVVERLEDALFGVSPMKDGHFGN